MRMVTSVPSPDTCDSEDCLHTLAPHAVVDHAEVLPAVLHLGLLDDEGASHLLDSLIQSDGLLVVVVLHELVPPGIKNVVIFYLILLVGQFSFQLLAFKFVKS